MAHVAIVDSNNTVIDVLVINNDSLPKNGDFDIEVEQEAKKFLQDLGIVSEEQKVLLTSFNSKFRYNFAGVGHKFMPDVGPDGAFVSSPPFPSWVLNDKLRWEAPSPQPGPEYFWNESSGQWETLT